MNLKPWQSISIYLGALALVLTSMVFLSWSMVRLDGKETEARLFAIIEENVRLSLWRVDSEVSNLLAGESARPFADYTPGFNPAPGCRNTSKLSSLAGQIHEHVRLHFVLDGKNKIVSPEVPEGRALEEAKSKKRDLSIIKDARVSLGTLKKTLSVEAFRKEVDSRATHALKPVGERLKRTIIRRRKRKNKSGWLGKLGSSGSGPSTKKYYANKKKKRKIAEELSEQVQNIKNSLEFSARAQSVRQASSYATTNAPQQQYQEPAVQDQVTRKTVLSGIAMVQRVMVPVWVEGELFLVRKVKDRQGNEFIQACWLDWPELKRHLQTIIRGLLPEAHLEAIQTIEVSKEARLMASLPAMLHPGEIPIELPNLSLSVKLVLLVAWAAVLLGCFAAGVMVVMATSLSERRAAFVSAVTHELRTPLTTFRMYTEMLTEGMVPNPEKQQKYLITLKQEAIRLAHLVENVLSYARIERGREEAKMHPVEVSELLERSLERLGERSAQVGMALEAEVSSGPIVKVNAGAIEQILFNLVDNACKYAVKAEDQRIVLKSQTIGKWVEIEVRDFGPGVDKQDQKRMFAAFSKSAHRAANSAPGVGLGLALSRRLAQAMGGRLEYRGSSQGAVFVLKLPRLEETA